MFKIKQWTGKKETAEENDTEHDDEIGLLNQVIPCLQQWFPCWYGENNQTWGYPLNMVIEKCLNVTASDVYYISHFLMQWCTRFSQNSRSSCWSCGNRQMIKDSEMLQCILFQIKNQRLSQPPSIEQFNGRSEKFFHAKQCLYNNC